MWRLCTWCAVGSSAIIASGDGRPGVCCGAWRFCRPLSHACSVAGSIVRSPSGPFDIVARVSDAIKCGGSFVFGIGRCIADARRCELRRSSRSSACIVEVAVGVAAVQRAAAACRCSAVACCGIIVAADAGRCDVVAQPPRTRIAALPCRDRTAAPAGAMAVLQDAVGAEDVRARGAAAAAQPSWQQRLTAKAPDVRRSPGRAPTAAPGSAERAVTARICVITALSCSSARYCEPACGVTYALLVEDAGP